jgi:Arc/MetJ-type ribon-helix-helix transcriptional regulator
MSHIRNHVSKGQKPVKKQSHKTEQLQNIISLRINDEEKKKLERLTKSTSKSISDIMREAISLWSSKRRKLCMD